MGQGSSRLCRVFLLCGVFLFAATACLHDELTPITDDVSNANATPIADAGWDRTILAGETVTLNGEGSSDIEHSPLSYHWEVVQTPDDSSYFFNDPTLPSVDFSPVTKGKYRVHLVVSDGQLTSAPDEITITVNNTAPIAKPTFIGSPSLQNSLQLDGSQSYDRDGHPISFEWSLMSQPAGSQASVLEPNARSTEMFIDVSGTYVIHLVVNDGFEASQPSMLTVSVAVGVPGTIGPPVVERTPPVAEAGNDIVLFARDKEYALDARDSYDTNAQSISYKWKVLSHPPGSTALLTNSTIASPGFFPDVRGSYVMQLEVTNFSGLVDHDTVVLTDKRMGLLCGDCHNGIVATGVSNHPDSLRDNYWDCGECHVISHWTTGPLVVGSHFYDKVTQGSLPIPYSVAPAKDHSGVNSRCDECHQSLFNQQRIATHPNTSTRCNACHETTTWLSKQNIEHTKALGLCLNCHNKDKSLTHPVTTADCNLCHSITDWALNIQDPHLVAQSNCVKCHDLNITSFHDLHDIYGTNCGQCHNTVQWTPVSASAKHSSILAECFYCHNNNLQTGKPTTHKPTTNNCEYCHTIFTFQSIYYFDHSQVDPPDTPCNTCHNLPTDN